MQKMGWFGLVRGHSRSWGLPPFDRVHITSHSTLIETMCLSCTVWDIAGYLSKVADFDPPHLHVAPSKGVTPVKFRRDLWHQKTRVPELPCGFVCVILCLAILVELRLVTDTDTGPWLVLCMHSIAWWKTKWPANAIMQWTRVVNQILE